MEHNMYFSAIYFGATKNVEPKHAVYLSYCLLCNIIDIHTSHSFSESYEQLTDVTRE